MLEDSSQTPCNQRLYQLIELFQPSFHVFNTNQSPVTACLLPITVLQDMAFQIRHSS